MRHLLTIAFDGELFDYLISFLKLFVTSQMILFVASSKDLITTSAAFLISHALLDTTTAWVVEITYNGGYPVMT